MTLLFSAGRETCGGTSLAYVATLRAAGNLSFELAQILWIATGRVNNHGHQSASVFLPGIFLAQTRKGAKRCRVFGGFLCAFAPLREKYSCHRCALSLLCNAGPSTTLYDNIP